MYKDGIKKNILKKNGVSDLTVQTMSVLSRAKVK
jgi:hypothetical protein